MLANWLLVGCDRMAAYNGHLLCASPTDAGRWGVWMDGVIIGGAYPSLTDAMLVGERFARLNLV